MPQIKLGLRVRLLLLVALPLMATFATSNAVGWKLSQQIIDDTQHTPWTTEADKARAIELVETTRTLIVVASAVIVGLTLLGVLLWFREFHRPIDQLTNAALRISNGDLDTPVPKVSNDELGDLARTLESTRSRLRATLDEAARQAKMEAELRAEARHSNELSLLLALSQSLLLAEEEQIILDLAVDTAAKLLLSDYSSVVLPNEAGDKLILRAVCGWPEMYLNTEIPPGTGSQTGYTLMQGKPIAVDDYRDDPPFFVDLEPDVTSGLSVPMIHAGRIVGALFVHSRQKRHFDQEDIRLLSLVANQTATAMERARLYKESVAHAGELRTIARVGEALNRAENAKITLRLVLAEALNLVNTDQGCIILVEPDDYTLRLETWLGIPDDDVKAFNDRRFKKYHGIFARSILRSEMVEVGQGLEDTDTALQYADTVVPQKVNVPLKTDDKVIGVISLNGLPVDDGARRMLVALSDLAATAIAKARLHEQMRLLAVTDDLTGLHNRRGILQFGEHEVERARRFSRPLAAIMFDIDHFKHVNDNYGHAAGNQVLAKLAHLCRDELRDVDLLGRYGGEEFLALLPESNMIGAQYAAERMRRAVADSVHHVGTSTVTITVSFGIAVVSDGDEVLAQLIDRADQALYMAKRSGRNRVCAWTVNLMDTPETP